MIERKKVSLLHGTAAMFMAYGLATGSPVLAQAAAENAEGDIVVTARLRQENLLEVPAAISALTTEDLQKGSIQGLENLAAQTPGLSFQSIGGTYQAPVIRGLAQIDQTGVIGNVGVFIDGIYLNNRSGLEFGMLDVARVEVVKGPQSALYGRNTFAGAINYVTNEPKLGEVTGSAVGEIGDHGRKQIQGSLSIPLADSVALRVWGGISKFDGTILNRRDGGDIGGWDKRSNWGAALRVEPDDRMKINLFFTRSDFDEDQSPYSLIPTTVNNCGSQSTGPLGRRFTFICGKQQYIDSVNLDNVNGTGLVGHQLITYGKMSYDLDFATVTGTVGYTYAKFSQSNDATGDALAVTRPLTNLPGETRSQQIFAEAVGNASKEWSYDLKLTSPGDNPFRWIVGLYHFDSSVSDDLVSYYVLLNNFAGRAFAGGRGGRTNIKGYAVYGSAEYDFNEALTLAVEGRYSEDTMNYQGLASVSSAVGKAKWNYFTPKANLRYKFSSDAMAWVSAGRGYKIGGFNSNAFGRPEFGFAPETNWTYELGAKAALLDRKLTVASSLFYIDWSNIQVQGAIPSTTLNVVRNSKGATSKGIEFDATYNFTPNLWLRGAVALMDPKYKAGTVDAEVAAGCGEIPGSTVQVKGCTSQVGGNQLARTTKTQISVNANWTIPDLIGDFDMFWRADYSYQASKHTTSLNLDEQGKIELVNAQVGFETDNFTISAWVKNLFDVKYVARVTTTPSIIDGAPLTGVSQSRIYQGEGRTVGVRASYRF